MSSLSSRRMYRVNASPVYSSSSSNHSVMRLIMKQKCRRFGTNKLSQLLNVCNNHDSNDEIKFDDNANISRYKPLKWRVFGVSAKLPDGNWRQLIGQSGQTVLQLVMPLVKEFPLREPIIRINDTHVLLDPNASAALLEGEEIVISEGFPQSHLQSEIDERYAIVEKILITERQFGHMIKTVKDLYEKPLRKLLCLKVDEHRLLFDWIQPMCSMSNLLQSKLQKSLASWDSKQTRIGAIFSKQLWNQYEDYLIHYPSTISILKEKQMNHDEFVVICQLRQGAAKHSITDLIQAPLERIAQYDNYLSQMVTNTSTDHPDYHDLCRTSNKVKSVRVDPKNDNMHDNGNKKAKKQRKPTINWPFKKIGIKVQSSNDSGMGSELSTPSKGKLFGQHLDTLCSDGTLPKPIMNMLKELFDKGPYTVGIFRKSANARVCKEFRAKLESDLDTDVRDVPVIVIASVFKEFLRSLPDCVLQSQLYSKWIDAIGIEDNEECRSKIAQLVQSLPSANLLLLRHFLCALWYIAHRSSINKMCSENLGVCVGQSLLCPYMFGNPNNVPPSSRLCEEMSKHVPKLIAYLIDHCPVLLGDAILMLLGPPSEKDVSRQDSGAEESDSLNSLPDHGVGSNTSSGSGGNRRDDSSIDSLERALMDDSNVETNGIGNDNATATFRNKMSLSNLSRDSGLTLSDTQLYNPKDEESESSDNSGGGVQKSLPFVYPYFGKSLPHLDSMGLDSGINFTFSYGRSVGVSIDGSCHDVVRKRRHQQVINEYPHYLNQNNRNAAYGHNQNHHYLPNQCHRPLNIAKHTPSPHNVPIQSLHSYHNHHAPLHYSKSYSYGINGDDVVDGGNSNLSVNGNVNHNREYRYRRPPLASILGGASTGSVGKFGDNVRLSNSEESLVRPYDNEVTEVGSYQHMSLPYQHVQPQPSLSKSNHNEASAGASSSSTYTLSPVQYNHNSNGNKKNSFSFRADVHQMNGHDSSTPRKVHHQMLNGDRVSSICSSSSETASQRSSISKQSNLSKSSSSLRSNPLGICPPSYQEAMSRKEMLARVQSGQMPLRKTSSSSTASSANSNQIYEESVRIYHEDIKTNMTHRAVPVRVKTADSDSDFENERKKFNALIAANHQHKQVQRTASEGTALKSSPSVVRISAQNSHYYHPHQQVTVLQRSAKDFTEDWRKDINCSVARLRTLFNTDSSSPQRTKLTNERNNIVSVRKNSRPVSVLIENNNNTPAKLTRPASIQDTTITNMPTAGYKSIAHLKKHPLRRGSSEQGITCKIGAKESGPCVTVVYVSSSGQNEDHDCPVNGKSVITVHRRSDSVGNSSEEESYV